MTARLIGAVMFDAGTEGCQGKGVPRAMEQEPDETLQTDRAGFFCNVSCIRSLRSRDFTCVTAIQNPNMRVWRRQNSGRRGGWVPRTAEGSSHKRFQTSNP